MVTKKIFLKSHEEMFSLLGQQDENLRRLEKAFGVQLFVKQDRQSGEFTLVVRGPNGKVEKAIAEVDFQKRRFAENRINKLYSSTNNHILGSNSNNHPPDPDTIYATFHGKHIKPRSEHQRQYTSFINKYDMVFGVGPSGTGKTFLSVACALRALHMGKASRIVLTRPVVEAGERLGFLPGDLSEKINPYLKPLYDAFYAMLGPEKFRFLREEETIEIVPLAYMRGRTIEDAFIILDEAQNTTPEQMKMFLTRTGAGSQVVVTGDMTQIDLENKKHSGLVQAEKIFRGIEGIKFVYFSEEDVVRHNLVKKVILAYDEWDKNGTG